MTVERQGAQHHLPRPRPRTTSPGTFQPFLHTLHKTFEVGFIRVKQSSRRVVHFSRWSGKIVLDAIEGRRDQGTTVFAKEYAQRTSPSNLVKV